MASSAAAGGQQVRLNDLPAQTLSQLKKQLDEEVSHLTNSFQSLRSAQAKFNECLKSLSAALVPEATSRTILVPLTASLYVPGRLADTDKVLVDVGTGFYVEKDRTKAKVFYEGKIKELGTNLDDLEKIVGGKSDNLRMVEEVLRQKLLAQGGAEGSAAGAQA
ncbi:Prefoldin alpha subunit [Microthyrium microscopicum]|uniref:Prefoldin alpha subunit n=1 Tax=Microthyrium microscopicum TaxID=703497 RepID=A0A6A6U775_9PEZI|nr:Prefoldin alpha subunit [Microthyrium microscopicum]